MKNRYFRYKHPRRASPGSGYVAIGEHSSLRKLMRAAHRDKIPDERMVIIQTMLDPVFAHKR